MQIKPSQKAESVTSLNVFVQLIDKGVQLRSLLGRKLNCIAGVNPLTQRADGTESINVRTKVRNTL